MITTGSAAARATDEEPDVEQRTSPEPTRPTGTDYGEFSACESDGYQLDFNCDQELSPTDVREFQSYLFSDGVQENPEAFDLAGDDGIVSHGDVIQLFIEVASV